MKVGGFFLDAYITFLLNHTNKGGLVIKTNNKTIEYPFCNRYYQISPKRINKTSDYLRKMIYSNAYLIDISTLNDQSLSY